MLDAVLAQEIAYRNPAEAFAPFARRSGALFLDSAVAGGATGRYSFIAAEPWAVLRSRDGKLSLAARHWTGDPFAALAAVLDEHRVAPRPGLPPFQTGAAGYLAYDLGRHVERLPRHARDDQLYPDLLLGLYDVTLAFDHRERRAWIFSSGAPETAPPAREARARRRLAETAALLDGPPPADAPPPPSPITPIAEMDRAAFVAGVRRAIDYIRAGDIYQANLSQRFRADLPAGFDGYGLYRALRRHNPAPFAAYLALDEVTIASASPERFLRLRDRMVETRPIKGTRPRGATPTADRALAEELLRSAKDRAENLMIVDLLRNDLSRVCSDVAVPALCALESFATVHHLVSVVTGRLREGTGTVELLRAAFPGGSITGAPKIRAIEVIAELEPTQRGPYCGSIGYLGFDGSMDTSIAIRTFTVRGGVLTFQVGAGIVADSDPEAEYEECMTKAAALFATLRAPG